MTLNIKPWSIENFKDLPSFRFFPNSCKHCAYWESLNFDNKTKKEDAEQIKRKWFAFVHKDFGNCGFIAYRNNKSVGFAQYAPMKYFPTISKYRDLTPSRDSIFLTCLYIPNRELRRKGIGKQLCEKIAWDLKNRGYKSIETFTRIRGTLSNDISGWLTHPLEFFIKMDFQVIKQKNSIAHLRKEL